MIKSTNPTTGKLIQEFKLTTKEEIDSIYKKAKKSQKDWQNKSKEARIEILTNLKTKFEDNKDNLINTINEECGFDNEELEGVFFDVLDGFDYYINQYKNLNTINFPIDQQVFPESTCEITHHPHGLILQIGAWNYPLWQTMITAIPALLTGNVILFKPSERATKTGIAIANIINSEQSLPRNIFNLIIGNKEVGKYLTEKKFDCIVYTGNIETGKEIAKYAPLTPKILELSGNDAAIICKDHTEEQTIKGIIGGAMLHSGEVCDRIKRVYITKENESLILKLVEQAKTVTEKITPLIDEQQLEKVNNQVQEAIKDGAKVLTGGKIKQSEGFFYEPTILLLPNNNCYPVKNEIFGPILSIVLTDSEEQSIEYANETEYGLGTSIWTQDMKKAKDYANKVETGMVWINDSNIPLVCGEYFQGWKNTSIPGSESRLKKFLKSKTSIYFDSIKNRDWWL